DAPTSPLLPVSDSEKPEAPHAPVVLTDLRETRERRREAWERRLPPWYTIAVAPGPNSLLVHLDIESVQTAVRVSTNGLIDCGATSDFIDAQFVRKNQIPVRKLSEPIPVYNV